MKSLSVKNPYAQLILQEFKTIEVRSRKTLHRGDILICVSKNITYAHQVHWTNADVPAYEDINVLYEGVGMAIAIAEIIDVTPFEARHESLSFVKFNPHHPMFAWHLDNIRPIEPFEVSGSLGFFETPDHMIKIKTK